MEQAEPQFEDVEGDVVARTHEIARWRETGEVAYERDFAVRLTLDHERSVVHNDFMIGNDELLVSGVNSDGSEMPIMTSGAWHV